MGAESAESAHSRDDGKSALSDVAAEDTFDHALDDVWNDGGDEEHEEVVAVNAMEEENTAVVALFHPPPQSLPAFVGRGVGESGVELPGAFIVPGGVGAASSAVSSSTSRGGTTRKTNTPKPPRRSSTSLSGNISSGGVRGGEKTKNSTNRERGSISKAMYRMAESIESEGKGAVEVI